MRGPRDARADRAGLLRRRPVPRARRRDRRRRQPRAAGLADARPHARPARRAALPGGHLPPHRHPGRDDRPGARAGAVRRWRSPTALVGGIHQPEDGHVNPGLAALALAHGRARARRHVPRGRRGDRVRAGRRPRDRGARRRRAGSSASAWCWRAACGRATWPRLAGASVPLWPAAHVHVRTVPIAGATADLPVIRDLDAYFYVRHANGALLVGAFEPDGKPLDPAVAAAGLLVRRARARLGALRAGARAGRGAHPGAARRRVRAVPERARVVHARRRLLPRRDRRGRRACTWPPASTARASSTRRAPAGRWRSGSSAGSPTRDVSGPRRAALRAAAVEPRATCTPARREGLGRLYAMHWPHLQPHTARNIRRTPLHDRVDAAGAVFGETVGYERANWYAPAGHAARVRLQLRPAELVRARRRTSIARRARRRRCSTSRRSPRSRWPARTRCGSSSRSARRTSTCASAGSSTR